MRQKPTYRYRPRHLRNRLPQIGEQHAWMTNDPAALSPPENRNIRLLIELPRSVNSTEAPGPMNDPACSHCQHQLEVPFDQDCFHCQHRSGTAHPRPSAQRTQAPSVAMPEQVTPEREADEMTFEEQFQKYQAKNQAPQAQADVPADSKPTELANKNAYRKTYAWRDGQAIQPPQMDQQAEIMQQQANQQRGQPGLASQGMRPSSQCEDMDNRVNYDELETDSPPRNFSGPLKFLPDMPPFTPIPPSPSDLQIPPNVTMAHPSNCHEQASWPSEANQYRATNQKPSNWHDSSKARELHPSMLNHEGYWKNAQNLKGLPCGGCHAPHNLLQGQSPSLDTPPAFDRHPVTSPTDSILQLIEQSIATPASKLPPSEPATSKLCAFPLCKCGPEIRPLDDLDNNSFAIDGMTSNVSNTSDIMQLMKQIHKGMNELTAMHRDLALMVNRLLLTPAVFPAANAQMTCQIIGSRQPPLGPSCKNSQMPIFASDHSSIAPSSAGQGSDLNPIGTASVGFVVSPASKSSGSAVPDDKKSQQSGALPAKDGSAFKSSEAK